MPFNWTVSGNIGKFTQGQKLTTPAEVGEYFRTTLAEGNDQEITEKQLSDAIIWTKLSEKYPEGGPENPHEATDAEVEVDPVLTEAILVD